MACLESSPESMMEIRCQPVQYLGELRFYGRSILVTSPCFTKPAKYKHQKEYRIVWYPCYSEDLHVNLRLGSLKDIAKVVLRDDLENGSVKESIFDESSFHKAADEAIRNNI